MVATRRTAAATTERRRRLPPGPAAEQGPRRARKQQAAYDHLVRERGVSPSRIVLYGRSLGDGPSIRLAAGEGLPRRLVTNGVRAAHQVNWAVS